MWEGLDHFLTTQEIGGEAILDFKDFQAEVSQFMVETRKAMAKKGEKEIFEHQLEQLRDEQKNLTNESGKRLDAELFDLQRNLYTITN